MSDPIRLSIEQEFGLEAFKARVRDMDVEEVRAIAIAHYELMLAKDAFFARQLGQKWGIISMGGDGGI